MLRVLGIIGGSLGVCLGALLVIGIVESSKPEFKARQTVTAIARATEKVVLAATEAARPTDTPTPTRTIRPTSTPRPTNTLKPTNTPKPTKAARPSSTPKPTNTARPTNTPKPTITPVPTSTPRAAPLAEFRSTQGWVFRIESIESADAFETPSRRLRPENGTFLVLIGSVLNQTDKDGCLMGGDFTVVNGRDTYRMTRQVLEAAKQRYGLDYPGLLRGQCLDYDAIEDSFLVFDIPMQPGDWWLSMDDARLHLGALVAGLQPDLAILARPAFETGIATAVATASPTPPPTPETISIAASVTSDLLNVREGPGTEFRVVGQFKKGDKITLIGRTSDATWYQVRLPNANRGWVSGALVRLASPGSALPVAAAPSPPPRLASGNIAQQVKVELQKALASCCPDSELRGEGVRLDGRNLIVLTVLDRRHADEFFGTIGSIHGIIARLAPDVDLVTIDDLTGQQITVRMADLLAHYKRETSYDVFRRTWRIVNP